MPLRLRKPLQSAVQSIHNTPLSHLQYLCQSKTRSFSIIPRHAQTKQREAMFRWINGPGAVFRDPLPGSTNYLNAYDKYGRLLRSLDEKTRQEDPTKDLTDSAEDNDGEVGDKRLNEENIAGDRPIPKEDAHDLMPFPMNMQFKSQAVLSEELKDHIYDQVVRLGKTVKVVSAELNVEMRRVGAVVRLKTIEKQWVEQGKRLAMPYANAIHHMLPKTPYIGGGYQPIHESIHDLPVHRTTLRQIFHPVSESRHFTRADAGKVFSRDLLPPENRVPHPELIELERLKLSGVHIKESKDIIRKQMLAKDEMRDTQRKEAKEREERTMKKVVPSGRGRWEFWFRDISVESVGKDGRDSKGVGARYGLPAQDRKRGQIKIPKKVE